MSEKQRLLSWFYRVDFPAGELNFSDLLERGAQEVLGKDPIAAGAYSVANAARIWNAVRASSLSDEKRGLLPLMRVTDVDTRRAIWLPKLSYFRKPSERRRLLRARARAFVIRVIDTLSDREYEALCCVVASLAGADQIALTPPSGEGGIDSFARLCTPGTTHLFSGLGAPLRVICQSKKYNDKVGVEKVRELV